MEIKFPYYHYIAITEFPNLIPVNFLISSDLYRPNNPHRLAIAFNPLTILDDQLVGSLVFINVSINQSFCIHAF